MYIIKASGERAKFDKNRVRRTCMRAGADKDLADKVVRDVSKSAYDGMPTKEILRFTLQCLKKENPKVATRYNLKKAVLELGPGGFIFEKFIRAVLISYTYDAWFPPVLRGVCVEHEVDIIARAPKESPEGEPSAPYGAGKHPTGQAPNHSDVTSEGTGQAKSVSEPITWRESGERNKYMIECKYHNEAGIRTGIKIALYVWARFLDLRDGCEKGYCDKYDYPWLISNTKFSHTAIAYAQCKGMRLLGWKYPHEQGLEYLIDKNKVYPITILSGLDRHLKEQLFSHDIILCADLLREKNLEKIGLPQNKISNLLRQAQLIL